MTKYQLVPAEPTTEMLRAAQDAWLADPERRSSILYRAMLSASPSPPPEVLEEIERRIGECRRRLTGSAAEHLPSDRVLANAILALFGRAG